MDKHARFIGTRILYGVACTAIGAAASIVEERARKKQKTALQVIYKTLKLVSYGSAAVSVGQAFKASTPNINLNTNLPINLIKKD